MAAGCCGGGGTAGSRLWSLGRAVESRARVTKLRNNGARARAVKWLTAGETQARMQGTGRLKAGAQRVVKAWNENERGPPVL